MNAAKKLLIFFVFIAITSCSSDPIDKIQGVFKVDKESLKNEMNKQAGDIVKENAFGSALFNKAIENAVIEMEIKGDSVKGIIFIVGQSNVINAKVFLRNDSILMGDVGTYSYLKPTDNGLRLINASTGIAFDLIKTNQSGLSEDTQSAIETQLKTEKERQMFEDNLGKWQAGNIVDEFGDDTGSTYPYCIIKGSHTSSLTMKSDVYVKATIQDNSLFFQIFNESMTLKESMPDTKFGRIKIKYPDGTMKSEKVFFYENHIVESADNDRDLIIKHLYENDGELKLLIDLSTASKYLNDKYQFSIQKNNLDQIIKATQK